MDRERGRRKQAKPMVFGRMRRTLRRLRLERGGAATPILFQRAAAPPEVTLLARAGVVLLLMAAVFAVFLLDRSGLRDQIDGDVSVTDVIYFTMITITTVGYGDIVPVSDQARLIDAFFVTPVRIFVWFIFLGTAYQLIIQRLIEEWRMTRLQNEMQGHVVLCGFGHSGSIAASELLLRGWQPGEIVVMDPDATEVQRAADRGFVGLHGDASSEELLRVAAVDRAHSVIVSVGRDDTTVLVVLTIREIARRVRIVACVGEQENVKLVRASGADVIVSPPRFGGYLMADAVESSATVDFVAEALTFYGGYQLHERDPAQAEIGRAAREIPGSLVVEIRRAGRRIGCWKDHDLVIEQGDRLLVIDSDEALRSGAKAGRHRPAASLD
jgi:voltage-gated potassium channel